tara:strand:+ start:5911 stop:6756 length:846 start_codon:yes stop_codon:yes gene_type:complete
MIIRKIGIIGYGFVGKATEEGFQKNTNIFIVDPKIGTSISELKKFNPEFIFICVPTPMDDKGKQNNSILDSVFNEIEKTDFPSATLVLKSTVLPNKTEQLEKRFNNLVYNPEFLREKFANEDFKNSKFIILGGQKENCEKVKSLYEENSSCHSDKFIFTNSKKASFAKYIINTFLALKVGYFNEVYELLNGNQSDWAELIEILKLDSRIGDSHMDVPGPDGRKGFGGACFPKDTSAFLNYSLENNSQLSILEAAIKKNNTVRKQYDQLSKREKDQNVNFDI